MLCRVVALARGCGDGQQRGGQRLDRRGSGSKDSKSDKDQWAALRSVTKKLDDGSPVAQKELQAALAAAKGGGAAAAEPLWKLYRAAEDNDEGLLDAMCVPLSNYRYTTPCMLPN